MRFIQKWSFACANHLCLECNENHQKRSYYYFGFQILIGTLVKVISVLVSGLLLGILIPELLIVFVFCSLRMLAGGHHMNTYEKCISVSLILFSSTGLIAKHIYIYCNFSHIILLTALSFIFGLYALTRYAPKDNPNKRITDPKEIKKFKTLSIIYLFTWLGVTMLLFKNNLNLYAISLCFGLLLETATVTPTWHKIFEIINEKFTFKKIKCK